MRSHLLAATAVVILALVPHPAAAQDSLGGSLGGSIGAGGDAPGKSGSAPGRSDGGPLGGGALGDGASSLGDTVGDAVDSVGGVAGGLGGGSAVSEGARGRGGASGAVGGAVDSVGGAVGSVGTQAPGVDAQGAVGQVGGVAPGVSATGGAVGGTGAPRTGAGSAPGRRSGPGTAAAAPTPAAAVEVLAVDGQLVLVRLPLILLPESGEVEPRGSGSVQGASRVGGRVARAPARRLAAVPGVPRRTVEICRQTIAAEARPLGAVEVVAVSAGAPARVRTGVTGAPIEARITYARGGRTQVRQARIDCRVNAQGRVVALMG